MPYAPAPKTASKSPRIIEGSARPDDGKLWLASGIKLAFVPQEPVLSPAPSVKQSLLAQAARHTYLAPSLELPDNATGATATVTRGVNLLCAIQDIPNSTC